MGLSESQLNGLSSHRSSDVRLLSNFIASDISSRPLLCPLGQLVLMQESLW